MNTYQFTVMAYDKNEDKDIRIILGEADGIDKEDAFKNLIAEKEIDSKTIDDEYYKMNTVKSSIVSFETKEMEDKDIDYEFLAKESEIEILKNDSNFYDWLLEKAQEEISCWDVEGLFDFVKDSLNTDDDGIVDDYRMQY